MAKACQPEISWLHGDPVHVGRRRGSFALRAPVLGLAAVTYTEARRWHYRPINYLGITVRLGNLSICNVIDGLMTAKLRFERPVFCMWHMHTPVFWRPDKLGGIGD